MRLSTFEIEFIKDLAIQHFGTGTSVYLFGSRIDNTKKGGDIDLFIQNSNNKELTIKNKLHFLTDLVMKIGEQKIDVVLDQPNKVEPNFLKTIYQTGIKL